MDQKIQGIEKATSRFLDDVKRIMDEKGINQSDLARRLDVSPAQVSKILSGRVNLTIATLVKVSNALDVPVSLRMGPTEDGSKASLSGEADEPTCVKQPSATDLEADARKLLDQMGPEKASRLIKRIENRSSKGPGRPKNSGLIPDDDRLDQMADLIFESAESERAAAAMVAKKDPGHSEKSTARRLRRKFSDNREHLLATAKARFRRKQSAEAEAANQRKSAAAPSRAPINSSPPMVEMSGTRAFLDSLRHELDLSPRAIEQLQVPYMMEEVSQLGDLQLDSVTKPLASGIDEALIGTAKPIKTPGNEIKELMESNLAAKPLSTQVPSTKDLAYNLSASTDITGISGQMRELGVLDNLDRRLKRLANPWSDFD